MNYGLVSKAEWERLLQTEGIDPSKAYALRYRWTETAPCRSGVRSILATCDLVIRDDGSMVYLDGCMGTNSLDIARFHQKEGPKLIQILGWMGYQHCLEDEHHCKIPELNPSRTA